MQKNGKKVRIFSALEVANICGVVNQTAVNWIKNGHLKAFTTPGKQYRVYSEDLIRFLLDRGMRIPEELQALIPESEESHKIIIVDDDESVNNILKRFLSEKMEEYSILQAFDGFEAGRLISENKPTIIILDIKLPGVDGNKLCRQIKGDSKLGDPIIVAITGAADEESKANIMSDGADACFLKPLDFGKLVQTIKDLAESRSE